jgi:hypothetical protein
VNGDFGATDEKHEGAALRAATLPVARAATRTRTSTRADTAAVPRPSGVGADSKPGLRAYGLRAPEAPGSRVAAAAAARAPGAAGGGGWRWPGGGLRWRAMRAWCHAVARQSLALAALAWHWPWQWRERRGSGVEGRRGPRPWVSTVEGLFERWRSPIREAAAGGPGPHWPRGSTGAAGASSGGRCSVGPLGSHGVWRWGSPTLGAMKSKYTRTDIVRCEFANGGSWEGGDTRACCPA